MLPRVAFTGFASRYKEPQLGEGFQDIVKVDFTVCNPYSYLDCHGRGLLTLTYDEIIVSRYRRAETDMEQILDLKVGTASVVERRGKSTERIRCRSE